MKNTLFCPQFSPQNAENRILGLSIFKIFWGSTSAHPPRPSGTNMPYLIQSVTLFKHAGYFNFYWNPWLHDQDKKMPNFTIYGGRKQAMVNFFSFSSLGAQLGGGPGVPVTPPNLPFVR